MNGVATLEQRQQPTKSTADWQTPLPSGLSRAGSLAPQAETPTSKTSPVGTSHTVEDSAILGAVKKDLEINIHSLATRLGCTNSTLVSRLLAFGYRKVLARSLTP
ncbi:hypothetical protein RB195_018611 [Necator americanus]|uniref:DNA binding HTH domain-containing protein n=1 Tax=Necator americanus TaxID=51031 RepID=A0ABR1CDD0_NECAM